MLKKILRKLKNEYAEHITNPPLVKGKNKIFCIGRNKTGTTSLKRAFQNLGFITGNQKKAERLLPDYKNGNFNAIINYCSSAQVFQDFPFSYPETFRHLDQAFLNAKFILTLRDSPEQWYNSVIKFQAKKFGEGNMPTKKDLQNSNYIWKGWMWECNRIMYNTPENDIYNKEILIATYNRYNDSVKDYFKDRTGDLLVFNIAEKDSYQKLMKFLNIESPFTDFPWENKTEKIRIR